MNSLFRLFGLSQSTITLANMNEMPPQTQLLLAYCLVQGDPEVSLMAGDSDAEDMVSAGWLGTIPNMTSGILSFKFQPDAWSRLKSLRPEFLAKIPIADIQFYAKTKSAQYPWVW